MKQTEKNAILLAIGCIYLSGLFIFVRLKIFIVKREATIYDIARELNLSASTVSRALKDNPVINKETRRKVQKCAERLGYRSNAFASSLRTRRTNTIGVIVPRLDSNFMSACLAGMEEVSSEKGYNLIISQSLESVEKEALNANIMFNKRVDGVIASLTVEDRNINHFQCFIDKNVPVVFFDRVPQNTSNACFVIDNYEAAYVATKHLIEQGCKRIMHLTLQSPSNVYIDRIKGYQAAIQESGCCSGNVVYLNGLNLESGKAFVSKLLQMKNRPDGLFVANDLTAVGCILGLRENNIRIPEDVALVGFNNDPISTIVSPELSTIAYPGREAGMLATKTLIEHLTGGNSIKHTNKVVLNSQLIVRASSRKI
jgi:LacI family transcriptional regulator